MDPALQSMSSASTSASELDSSVWQSRPGVARALRGLAYALPILFAVALVYVLDRNYRPTGLGLRLLWLVAMVGLSMAISRAVMVVTRRLFPMAALYQMSLVFPDTAPSRFGLALRRDTMADLKRRLENDDVTEPEAARTLVGLVEMLSQHDRYTRGHSERVRAYSDLIGEELGLSPADRQRLQWGALTHDLGKASVPFEILNSPVAPSKAEWEILRRHPAAGEYYVRGLEPLAGEWLLAASQHHERWDGGGYPNGLAGEEISLAGRIVAVADAFDVMTSVRSYKEAYTAEQARAELSRNAGSQFDPAIVRAFLNAGVDLQGFGHGWLASLMTLVPRLGAAVVSVTSAITTAAVIATAAILAWPQGTTSEVPEQLAATSSTEETEFAAGEPGTDSGSSEVGNPGGLGEAGPNGEADTSLSAPSPQSSTSIAGSVERDPSATSPAGDAVEGERASVGTTDEPSTDGSELTGTPTSPTDTPEGTNRATTTTVTAGVGSGAPRTTSPTTARPTTTPTTAVRSSPTTRTAVAAPTNRPTTTARRTTTTVRPRTTTTVPRTTVRPTTTTARPTTTTARPTTTTTTAPVPGESAVSDLVNLKWLFQPPPVVDEAVPALMDDNLAFMWFESGPLQVPSGGLTVDQTQPGSYVDGPAGSAQIPAGTTICSYLVFSDRAANNAGLLTSSFASRDAVLGVIYDKDKLAATSFLERPGTTYQNYSGVGEDDTVVLARNSVSLTSRARGTDRDTLRVITAC